MSTSSVLQRSSQSAHGRMVKVQGHICLSYLLFGKAKMRYICGSCFMPKKFRVGKEIILFCQNI